MNTADNKENTPHTPQTVLVTGGAGFIGSHLCTRLLMEGHRVFCVDNLSSGRLENIEPLSKYDNFNFIQGDISHEESLDFGISPTWIFNLACPASPPFYQADPIATMKTSVLGAINVLELARSCNARILQTSTSEVYGDPLAHPQNESYRGNVNCIGPRACYDEGKRAAEAIFFDYNRTYGTDVRVVRIFNTYGPHMRSDDGRVVSNFIWQALRGEDLTVYGEGNQTRSFCYIDDLVNGLMLMMEQDTFLGPVNLGNPHECTVIDLAKKVLEITGSESRIVCKNIPEDDPKRRKPDIALARKTLGWEPRVDLDHGIRKTIDYFRGLL